MPAVDDCEPQVIRALAKAGWMVVERPYSIRISEDRRFVYADLLIQNTRLGREIVVVEVKCFPEGRNELDEFYHAVGQCLLYRHALELSPAVPTATVYLALPTHVEATLLDLPPVGALLKSAKITYIVVDLESEKVVRWVD